MKFDIVITKVPQGSPMKVEQRATVTASQLEKLVEAGHEYVFADAWDAQQKVKASESAEMKAAEARVKKAIDRAIQRGAIEPKADTATITAQACKMEKTEMGIGETFIDNLPVLGSFKQGLSTRQGSSGDPTASDTHAWRGQVTASEAAEGYLKANQPNNKLLLEGKWIEANAEARAAGIRMKELIKAGGDDLCLAQVIKGASADPKAIGLAMSRSGWSDASGVVKADYTDPNTQVGILNTGLILMRNLGFLKNKLNFMQHISTDLRNEPIRFGQTIDTRYIVVPNVLTFVPGVGFTSDATTINNASAGTNQSGVATQTSGTRTPSVPSTPDVQVTLNQFKGVQIDFPITTLAGTVRNLFAEQRGAQTYALAEVIHQKFLSTIFAGTWTGTVNIMSLGQFSLPGMIRLKNRMTLSKIPDIGRFSLFHSVFYDGLLNDTNLLTAKAILALINKDASAFEQGEVPPLFGVQPLESQLSSYSSTYAAGVPSGTAALTPTIASDGSSVSFNAPAGATAQVGFAGNMSSMLFVARIPNDFNKAAADLGIPATNAVEIISDPDSNLSVMIFKFVDNLTMRVSVVMCLMYGFAQGDPRIGIVLTP